MKLAASAASQKAIVMNVCLCYT